MTKSTVVKTVVFDEKLWAQVLDGSLSLEDYMQLAAPGPDLSITEEELEEAISADVDE